MVRSFWNTFLSSGRNPTQGRTPTVRALPCLEFLEDRTVPATWSVRPGGGGDFLNITSAVNAGVVVNGDTIVVDPGTYNETITVNKSLTIRGNQAGVDARTGRVGASESIITGIHGGFALQANNIIIDGFTIQGVTGQLNAGISTAGAFSGYQILNNILQNNVMGAYLNSAGATQTQVRFNLIRNNNNPGPASGNGIYSDQGAVNILLDSNAFSGASNAEINFSAPGSGNNTNITISTNSFVDNTGIFLAQVTNSTINSNTFTNTKFQPVYLAGGNFNISITNNIMTGTMTDQAIAAQDVGLGFGTNGSLTISNNQITADVGTLMNPDLAYIQLDGVTGTNLVQGNTLNLTGSLAQTDVQAVRVSAASGAGNVVNVQANTLNVPGDVVGVWIPGGLAQLTGANKVFGPAPIGVLVTGATTSASISGATISTGGVGVGILVDAARVLIQNTIAVGGALCNRIGLQVQQGAVVDAGSLPGSGGPSNVTGLGTSGGNNALSGYAGTGTPVFLGTGRPAAGNFAIVNLNAGPPALLTTVYAQNNEFNAASIAGVIFDNADNGALSSVLFAPAQPSRAINANLPALAGAQRSRVNSIVYSFPQAVNIAPGAFTIALHTGPTINGNVAPGGTGMLPTLNFGSADGGFTWIVTFSGNGVLGGSIADGVYDITLNAGAVTNVIGGGPGLISNLTDTFYRLFGDFNGDMRINNADLNRISFAFLSRTGDANFLAFFDINGDGRVNNTDLNQFLIRFGSFWSAFCATL